MTQTLNRRTTLFLLTACLVALALAGLIERLTMPWRFTIARKPPEAVTTIYALGKDRTAEEITAINQMAQVIYNEARGIPDKAEQAAVAWCILNRVDTKGFPDTITEVIQQPYQFAWSAKTPIKDEFRELAADVYDRWMLEKSGEDDIGRVLPGTYLFFHGDGKHNYFRETYRGKVYWDWTLESPYED